MNIVSSKRPNFSVDRRPIAIFTPTPLGCAGSGMQSIGWSKRYDFADGFSSFFDEFFNKGASAGFRRFICMYPGGSAPSVGSANILRPLSESVIKISYGTSTCLRDNPMLMWGDVPSLWKTNLSKWRSSFGRSSSCAVGMSLFTPAGGFSDYASIGSGSTVLGVLQNAPKVLSWLNYNISGWKDIGADAIAFYGVNQVHYYNPRVAPAIQNFLRSNIGMNCIGIGAPNDGAGLSPRLGDAAYVSSPFVVRSDDGDATKALGGFWDPDRTEMHVSIPSKLVTEEKVSSYFERGLIVGIEFDQENPYSFPPAVRMVNEVYSELEAARIAKARRNMTVFSMVAGDNRDAYGQLDARYSSISNSKSNLSSYILPVIRVNCSAYIIPSDPARLFIPSWWWSNSKAQCPDPSMSGQVLDKWMPFELDQKLLLTSTPSPYGTTGPEKCADACFDMMMQNISKYGSLSDRPLSSPYDMVVSFDNWGGNRFSSDYASGGIVDGECRLFGHVDDILISQTEYPPLYDLSSPYISNGINECTQWLDRFAMRLKYRREGYSRFGSGNIPSVPGKFIFNELSLPKASHAMMDPIEKYSSSISSPFAINRNIDKLYGALSAILADSRSETFVFNGTTISSSMQEAVDSRYFDVDATSPDTKGSSGIYSLKLGARVDKDALLYQPNAPTRKWFNSIINEVAVHGIGVAFTESLAYHFPGSTWAIPGVTISNTTSYNVYDISSKVASDIQISKSKDLSMGGISMPTENRMHISRIVMPGIHNQSPPPGSNIICFDMAGSSAIRDGSFMPIWGASYNRPLVGVSSSISISDGIGSISLTEDRSTWFDAPGSIFSSKDATTDIDIKSGKPIKSAGSSNDVVKLADALSKANFDANNSILSRLVSVANIGNSVFMPRLLGPAVADASWDPDTDIGNIRTGSPSGSYPGPRYRNTKDQFSSLVNNLYIKGCSAVLHDPVSQVLGDWNAIYDVVSSINEVTAYVGTGTTATSVVTDANIISSSASPILPVSSSYAISIAYDYAFAKGVLQSTSRPKILVDREAINKGLFLVYLLSSDGRSRYNFSPFPIGDLRAIDLVNLLNRQNGLLSRIVNGNSNVFVKDLIINDSAQDSSGWIFMSLPAQAKESPTMSEARSRPLDYLRFHNTSMSAELYQSKASMSFGGFESGLDAFGSATLASPAYISSTTILINTDTDIGNSTCSINGEIMQCKYMGGSRLSIVERGMYGTRRKMHLPGDQIIFSAMDVFDSNFGSGNNLFEQYRCFAVKNVDIKSVCHNISFMGYSTSSTSKIEIAVETPSIQYKNMTVVSSGNNFIQTSDLTGIKEKDYTLIGTSIGIPLPNGKYVQRIVNSISGDKMFFSSSLPYVPATNSFVQCNGSRAGYSVGGLFYPSNIGNTITEFNSVMSGDIVYVDNVVGNSLILKPGEFIFIWVRRKIVSGAKNIEAGNFMPLLQFEVS
jgi:hypothetical protein